MVSGDLSSNREQLARLWVFTGPASVAKDRFIQKKAPAWPAMRGQSEKATRRAYFFISSFFIIILSFLAWALCEDSFDMPWVLLFAVPSFDMPVSVPILVVSWPVGPVAWADAAPTEKAPIAVAHIAARMIFRI